MITLIHGDDISASRVFLNEIRARYIDSQLVDGNSLTVTDLTQIMEGGDLFNTQKSIIIEHFYAKRKAIKEFAALVDILSKKALEHEIFIWEGKELDKKGLSLFKHATVKTFKLPQILFLFLDSIKPGQGKFLVQTYHKLHEHTEAELLFFMLIRQIRLLLALVEKNSDHIDEVKRMAPWQLSKLQKQATLFSPTQLIAIHTQLYELDKGMKTGALSMPLSSAIDILLLDI